MLASTMKMKDIYLCILCMLLSLLPDVEAETLIASVLALEGDAVEIACPTLESYDSYFWRKGDSIHDSTEVASFVDDVPRADSKNYAVTANGTLSIKNVTTKDEGKYFCRGVTDISSSSVEILVQVQASLQNFELSIDHCNTETSCFRYINFSKLIELICIAINASPSMTLTWFNGSREIQSNITVDKYNQKDVPSSTMITSTLKAVYRTPVTLTCQAEDTKSKTNGGRFVNIRLEQQVPITNEKPPSPDQDLVGRGWMITAVILFVFCMSIMGMFMMYKMHRRYLKNGRPSVPNNSSVANGSVPNGSRRRHSLMSEEGG
ncbi:cell adhesion molecule 1-like [Apostichopus japonicus]|uniref:cell adhesion molecule 1-like n=1 Tax=Stichopus japonicus TaxID=307972 RepID=UPI003AB7A171